MTTPRRYLASVLLFFGLLAVLPAASCADEAPQWTWTGFEVVGQRTSTRDEILASPPVELGTPYDYDRDAIGAWCRELEERLDLHHARCSPVRFAGGEAYLVVNVVEKGDEHRTRLRPPPEGEVTLATAEIRELFEQLESRQWALFEQGKPPRESSDEGYLDYDDEEMHGYVVRLRELLPPHRENLFEVIARDRDAEKRGAAARLLNWAGDTAESIARVHPYLDDPSVLVRNNLARFMLHYVDQVESAEVRRSVIGALADMLERPSHADRNKAVYGLLNLAKARADDRAYVLEAAGESLERLAEQSILVNVRDPAQELLALARGEPAAEEGEEMDDAEADPVLAKLVPRARADLAQRLSIPEDEIEIVSAERVTWRDSSLGCPEEGMFYMQMLTPGARIELRAGGEVYPYHSNLDGPPFYCEKPSKAGPLPAEE